MQISSLPFLLLGSPLEEEEQHVVATDVRWLNVQARPTFCGFPQARCPDHLNFP